MLGCWWLEAAVRGALPTLPVVNIGAVEQAADRLPATKHGAAAASAHWATRSQQLL